MSTANSNEIQLGAQGRVVIPAALRKALHLEQGDRLIARKVAVNPSMGARRPLPRGRRFPIQLKSTETTVDIPHLSHLVKIVR